MKISLERDRWAGLILGVIALLLYSTTRSSSLASIDAGELAAVQVLLGIAHPSGYPLFTMAGHLWSKLPLGMTAISQLNLLATVYCALSIPFFFKAFLTMLSGERSGTMIELIAAISGTMILMLSQTFWSTSTGTEVYSLQLLLISITMWVTMKAVYADKHKDRQWVFVAFALGLCFANHLTAVLLIPGTAYLFFSVRGWNKTSLKTVLIGALGFLAIVGTAYSYLYFRAGQNPVLNWGDPDTLARLWTHIRAKQYNVYIFESFDVAWDNLRYFIISLSQEFSFIGTGLFLYGVYMSLKANRMIAIFLVICLLSNVALAINYNIPDLTPYFLIAFVVVAAFISFGLCHIMRTKFTRLSWSGVYLMAGIVPLVLLFQNYDRMDQSSNYVLEDYITHALNSVEENAILLSNEFETDISPAYYMQLVEELRKDVVVIDFLSFIGKDWYSSFLAESHPVLVEQVSREFDQHKIAMERFDGHDQGARLDAQNSFKELINQIVLLNFDDRPIYIGHGVYRDYLRPGGYIPLPFDHWIVPQTYYYRIYPRKEYRKLENAYSEPSRYPESDDRYTFETQEFGAPNAEVFRDPKYHIGEIRFARALMMDHRIQYEIKNERWGRAQEIYEMLKLKYPAYTLDSRVLKAMTEKKQIK